MTENWTCLECGAEMAASQEEFQYLKNGLRVLLVGISCYKCTQCDYCERDIPRPEGLHKVLRVAIAEKPERLTGPEVRFLRKSMGWSGGDLAEWMGVSRETVSRWETSKREMTPTAERLLRLFALTNEPTENYMIHGIDIAKIKNSGTKPASPRFIRIVRKGDSWGASPTDDRMSA